jgi:glycosyltransferase involved in cell wall biosynthesis
MKLVPTISAVINTLNEEANIKHCLNSLKWCDEVIVVDMQSDDATAEIAKGFTNKVFEFERVGYVEPARKFAAEKATSDWVLIVDADELVPPTLASILNDIATKDSADVVYIPFRTYMLGDWIKHTGWWPEYHPRFFKRGCIEFRNEIHSEFIMKKGARKFFLPAKVQNAMEHFAYLDSEHFVSKLNRYTSIEAAHLHADAATFSTFKMFRSGISEFVTRYFKLGGFKDGRRGLFLSLMMVMYRVLIQIKLWEKYENECETISDKYLRLKEELVSKYNQDNPKS